MCLIKYCASVSFVDRNASLVLSLYWIVRKVVYNHTESDISPVLFSHLAPVNG